MNNELKNHVVRFLNKKLRYDGRKLEEFRSIELEYNVTKNAEGSARVKIGETIVIAGIKMSVEKPYPDTPDQGNLMVGVELLPMSSPDFEAGPPDAESIEIARVVDRGIRESKAIDNKKLCMEKGEKVWMVSIDIATINNDGNLLDASALASIAAIKNTRFPKYEDGVLNYKELTDETLPINKIPIAVTVCKIGNHLFVDPSVDEEKVLDARLTVTSTKDGKLCALQKGGDSTLTADEVDKMIELGMEKAKELAKYL